MLPFFCFVVKSHREVSEPSLREGHRPKGISLIFAIIVVTAMMVTTVTLSETILRSIGRVGEMQAVMQAQSSANSAFEEALVYISQNCDAGCDISDTITMDTGDLNTWAEYAVYGESQLNGSSYYYVPIPTLGSASQECTDETDEDDACNWNRLYYGNTVSIPLYAQGDTTFDGSLLEVRIRTANGENILCSDGTDTTSIYGCTFDNNPVIVSWQITGERTDGSDYVEGWENTFKNASGVKYRTEDDSQIHTTRLNYAKSSDYYTVLDLDDLYAPSSSYDTIETALQDATDPMEYPVLELTFVQSATDGTDMPITYLEYQIKTDVPISSDSSYITVTGYTESRGETYVWTKDGWFSQYSSSPINFVFQN